MPKKIRQLLPFAILVILIVIVYLTNIHHSLTLENIRNQEQRLHEYVHQHPFLSPLIFIGFYILSVCLVIPDSTILSLLGGLIFPLPLAIFYTVLSETVGATLFFSIFQNVFGKTIIQKERPFINRLRKGFRHHSESYLLFLRLSHIVPFWLTNFSAAYFRVPFWTFVWTTFVGVIPLSYILSDAGHSLSRLFQMPGPITIGDAFTTPMKIALLILGLMALLPIFYKKWIKRKKWKLKP